MNDNKKKEKKKRLVNDRIYSNVGKNLMENLENAK